MSFADWTRSETISAPDIITISWTTDATATQPAQDKTQKLTSTTGSTSTSRYQTFDYIDLNGNKNTQDVVVYKEDIKNTTKLSANQSWVTDRLKRGRGLPSGGDTERSVTTYEYRITTDGPRLISETTEVYISMVAFAGQMQGIPYSWSNPSNPSSYLYYDPPDDEVLAHKTVVEHEETKGADGRDYTRTKTSRWIALGQVTESKESLLAFLKAVNDLGLLTVELIDNSLWSHAELKFEGTEVQVNIGRAPVPAKPSNADLAANEVTNGSNIPSDATPTDVYGNNRGWTQFIPSNVDWRTLRGDSNGDGIPDWADYVPSGQDWKDYNTSDTDYSNPDAQASNEKSITGRVIFDGQNYDDSNPTVTATYQMPFAPDDYFYYDANGIRRLHRSGAKAAAIKFGQTEAALDIGHAYGQNIVTNFANTPTLDLSPVYVRLAGIEGAFLLDGTSYAWGPEGMVVSSDLLLIGVTGYDGTSAPATSWLRLPVAPAGIGPAGATTIEASPVKANSIAIPGGFDIRSPGAVLASLPTNGADVFREWRSNAPVVPPTLVLETEVIATGPALTVREFGYGLTLETDTAAIASGPAVDFAWVTLVTPPAAPITVAALAPTVSTGAAVKVPAAAVTVEALAPVVSSGASVQPPAAGLTLEGLAPELVGRPKTVVSGPAAEITIAAQAPTVSTGAAVLVPAAGITLAALEPTIYDSDALKYINAVEAADGQSLETAIYAAIDAFVRGCKTDGTWNAIKASCILAGARTLSGALVPLKGTAPTNNGFVSGDYNRKTGLVGDGSSKYLDSNRANNADPQDSQHIAVRLNTVGTSSLGGYIGDLTSGQTGASYVYRNNTGPALLGVSRTTSEFQTTLTVSGFVGVNRSASGSFKIRSNGSEQTANTSSATPSTGNIHVFRLNRTSGNYLYTNARIMFYSIGESITLSSLDSRVATLMTAISNAI